MEPYKAKKMPLEYKIDKEMLMLISEANVKYGEYKSLLNTLEFDAGFFLDSVILNESYKSTQIEGTQISQDEMYYLKYMEITDDSREIQNLKKTIEYASSNLHVCIIEWVVCGICDMVDTVSVSLDDSLGRDHAAPTKNSEEDTANCVYDRKRMSRIFVWNTLCPGAGNSFWTEF